MGIQQHMHPRRRRMERRLQDLLWAIRAQSHVLRHEQFPPDIPEICQPHAGALLQEIWVTTLEELHGRLWHRNQACRQGTT